MTAAATRKIWSLNYISAKLINFYVYLTLTNLESAHHCNMGSNFNVTNVTKMKERRWNVNWQ